jgi:hypothetical protein
MLKMIALETTPGRFFIIFYLCSLDGMFADAVVKVTHVTGGLTRLLQTDRNEFVTNDGNHLSEGNTFTCWGMDSLRAVKISARKPSSSPPFPNTPPGLKLANTHSCPLWLKALAFHRP